MFSGGRLAGLPLPMGPWKACNDKWGVRRGGPEAIRYPNQRFSLFYPASDSTPFLSNGNSRQSRRHQIGGHSSSMRKLVSFLANTDSLACATCVYVKAHKLSSVNFCSTSNRVVASRNRGCTNTLTCLTKSSNCRLASVLTTGETSPSERYSLLRG